MSPTTKNQLQDTNNDYVYAAAGNLTQPGPIGGPYVYDAENHLTSAGGVTYTYDGDGNRVMKSNGTITGTARIAPRSRNPISAEISSAGIITSTDSVSAAN